MAAPIALFAYARPRHLSRTLACLEANRVTRIYAFCDGPKTPEIRDRTDEVRRMIRDIDWCEVSMVERVENFGLGRSIRAGVAEVLARHGSVLVFEDDLICVDGTYEYLDAALEHYRDEPRVMSVTGWTHPRITPASVTDQPYFDGRAECWVWGTWRRAWRGMEEDAQALIRRCAARGIDPCAYGADLVDMARCEHERNIWAVRFLYWHILNGGLCLRPPRSLVQHIGSGLDATNAVDSSDWTNEPLHACPPSPACWPPAVEHPDCRRLAAAAYGRPHPPRSHASLLGTARSVAARVVRRVLPSRTPA